ncbi:MAG TPA: ABC transporter substrate-binding protein [Thermomicrobiales bacterium]|nr:ABC transporter substrate-binding protein [Thermomicrobiales bacterium]
MRWRTGLTTRAGILTLALLVALLAGCGSNAPTTAAGGAAATTVPATTAPTAAPTTAAASPSAAAAVPTAASPAAGSPAATGPAKPVKIGAVLSLTGAAQVYGTVQKNGIQLAVDEINSKNLIPGVQLVPVIEDDASTKDQGLTAFEKVIKTDNVTAIIGPTLSNTAVATYPVAQQAGVPTLGISVTASTGITDTGNEIFRDSLAEYQVIPVAIKTAKDTLGLKKVAILYGNDDAFTKAGYDVFKKALDDNGIQITSTQTFAKGDTDFSAQLTAIKGTNPDAIAVSALINEATQIVTQARQLGIKATIIGGNGFNSPALIKNAGPAAEGVIVGAAWHAGSDTPQNQEFIKNYKAKFNADPDQFAAQAYAGVYILADAIKRAGPNVDRSSLRDALTQVKNLPTVLGNFSFLPNRDADYPPVVQIVKDGKFEIFK